MSKTKSMQNVCLGIQQRDKKSVNDVVYTPKAVALELISMCDIKEEDHVLDPCFGKGIFYNNLPPCQKDWCEISMGKDFFPYNKPVDTILGNPPFSIWTAWIKKTIALRPNKIGFVMGALNLTVPRMRLLGNAGYHITKMTQCQVSWWFGVCYLVVWEKTETAPGTIQHKFLGDRINCDLCDTSCYRGKTSKGRKYGMNECSKGKVHPAVVYPPDYIVV